MIAVEVDPVLKSDPALVSSIREGAEVFQRRASAHIPLTARWSPADPPGAGLLVRLELAGPADRAEAVIPSNQLDRPDLVFRWLNWVWGDLLRNQSHRLLEQMSAVPGPDASDN